MRHKCDGKEEDVFSDCDDLQGRLNATAIKLSCVRHPLTVAFERREQHCDRPADSHFGLESLFSCLASHLVNEVSCLVGHEVAPHLARLTGVVASASYSLELDSWFTAELIRSAKRGVECPQLTLKR